MRRRDDDLERSRRDDCERRRRDRAVGDGEDTDPDVEDGDRARRNQIGASDGVEDPTPAARGLTGGQRPYRRRESLLAALLRESCLGASLGRTANDSYLPCEFYDVSGKAVK
ncbi:hypothetical protein F2Q68_00043677 [Brassica cretica]|uniref:Uncharacterized protein n=1 Tax=Brassica cretica TaxID=69181 RepID=A0A8S9LS44_BRACR|nr:hypothetical protein F2Q68_00043677 [Brassica cretica]